MFDTLSEKFSNAFRHISGKGTISESNIEEAIGEVRTALLEADVNFKVVKSFVTGVKEKALGEKVVKGVNPGEQFIKIVHDELALLMGEGDSPINWKRPAPLPVLIVGLNGAGKTTFAAKLSLLLRKNEKKEVLLVPADTFRPAAKEQLLTLARNIGVDYYDSDLSLPPEKIAELAIIEATRLKKDVVIIDTAGRLHVDDDLMNELKRVRSAVGTREHEIFLVADAMTGQEAVNVATTFHEALGVTGVVLSKMDSDARGGAALSIRHVTGIPIRYISVGEKSKDLDPFYPDRLSKRILDMGDVVSLVEKAQEVIDEKEAEKMMQRLEKNRFTIEDFVSQMNSMNRLGSFSSILKMLPGMGGMMRQLGDLSPAENEMKKMQVLISSMTKAERKDDSLLKAESRKRRIAKGSGTSVHEVNQFLNKFNQMRNMMSGLMGMMKGGAGGGLGALLGGMGGDMGMGEGPRPGFRQQPGMGGMPGKMKKKGKGKGPWGGGYF